MGYNYYYRAGKLSIRKEPHKRNIRVERAFGDDYSIEIIKNRILENDLVYMNKEKIIPYKTLASKSFKTKDKIKKKYKPKGIIALYYHYKFLLGLYTKNNVPHKLTPEMRAEVKKMEHYSEVIRFLCKYKLESVKKVEDLKDMKLQEKQDILNSRNRLYYKRGTIENENEKDVITKQIIQVTEVLYKIKKEIGFCDEVVNNSSKMREQVMKVEEKEQDKVKKKKIRKYEL